MTTIRNALSEDPKTSSLHRHINGRGGPSNFFLPSLLSQPLGFDRNGSSYWLLSVQEHSTLFPYTTSGQASLRTTIGTTNTAGAPSMNNNVIEPCVLIREPNGWWGYHSGVDLKTLFDSFSVEVPHEKRLRLRMIERMAMTRCLLRKGTLFVNLLQREWIDRRSRCETWLQNQTKIPDSMTIQQKTLFIELMWARCVEVRQFMHFSGVYRYEEDPLNQSSVRAEREGLQRKQKKLRDACLEDSFDLHPMRGWRRDDPLTPIRTIAASCTATRLIADPSIYQIYQQVTRRSVGVLGKRMYPLLEKNTLPPPSAIAPTASDDLLQQPAAVAAVASTSAPGGVKEERPPAIAAIETMDVEKPDAVATAAPSAVTIGKTDDSGAQIAVGGSDESAIADDHSMLDAEEALIDDDAIMDVEENDDDAIQFMINNEEDISQSMVVSEEEEETKSKTKSDAPIVVEEKSSEMEIEVKDHDANGDDLIQAHAAIDGVDPVVETSVVVDTDEVTPRPSDDAPAEEIVTVTEAVAVVEEEEEEEEVAAVMVEKEEDKFPFVDSNGLAILPNLKMLISSESSGRPYPPNIRCKSIELLHLITGEVVQIFPAGKDAATYFGISQSGISLCLHDIKPDYYGFKWKVYDGPVINFPYLSRFQFPLAAILQMQVTKHQRVDHYSIEDERRRVAHVLKQIGWAPNLQGLEVGSLAKSQSQSIIAQMTTSSSNSNRPPPRSTSVNKPVTINSTTPSSSSSTAVVISSGQALNNARGSSYPDPSIAALAQKNIITSTEVQSARFLRLKGELLNILYILPEKLLRLPDLDEEGEKAITTAGEDAAANIRQGVAKLSNNSSNSSGGGVAGGAAAAIKKKNNSVDEQQVTTDMDVDSGVKKEKEDDGDGASDAKAAITQSSSKVALTDVIPVPTTTSKHSDDEVEKAPPSSTTEMSMSNVERLADKAARKAKRRLRRKLSMDRFLKSVQTAVTPQQLMDVALCLEDAIPLIHTYKMTKSALPVTALSLGAVAIRIFALDRMIAYDELKGIDSVAAQCTHRLRTYFYPRCMQSSSCRGFLCHNSKCLHNFEPSRIPDIAQGVIATNSYSLPNFGNFQRPNNPQLYSRASNLNPSNTLPGDPQRRVSYAPTLPNRPKDEELPLTEILNKLRSFRKEIDVETIQPYVPVFGQDLDTTDWV